MKYFSQLVQDVLVDRLLENKTNGTFVDIGASYFDNMNNSYFFEKERGWKGLAVEIDNRYNEGWKNRPNTVYINEDALKVDYVKVLADNNMPDVIDYLSVDLEPPEVTYQAFCKIMETKYIFNVVTFEVDYYRDISTRDPARQRHPHGAVLQRRLRVATPVHAEIRDGFGSRRARACRRDAR
jgi:hypothetical protein